MNKQHTEYSESMYSDSRRARNNANNTRAWTILFLLIISLGIGGAFFYVQVFQKNTVELENRLFVLEQNQSLIKEALKITDSNFTDLDSERRERMQFLDDEIRKLWNVANRRNKKNIADLETNLGVANKALQSLQNSHAQTTESFTTQLETIRQNIEQMLADITQLNDIYEENIANIEKITTLVVALDEKIETKTSNIDALSTKVDTFSDSIVSLERQRGDLNTRVAKVSEDLNLLRSRMLSLENSIALPVNNATGQVNTP